MKNNLSQEHKEKVRAEFNRIKQDIENQVPIKQTDNLAERAALAADRAAVEAIVKAGVDIEQVFSGEYTVFIQHLIEKDKVKFIAACVPTSQYQAKAGGELTVEDLNNICDANLTGDEE